MVRASRKAIGLTQDDVAKRARVSRRAVVALEAGQASLSTFLAVADVVEFRVAGLPSGSTLGERIVLARKRRGWTQARLADRAGLSVPTIRGIERGTGHLSSLSAILAVLAPQVRARKSEKANWSGGRRDVRFTPPWLLNAITDAFGPVSIDPCAAEGSFVAADRYIFEEEDGLTSKWTGCLAFVNPPFSQAALWLERCHRAWREREVETVVALVPTRTNTRAFHDHCAGVGDVVFLRGRPNFINPFEPEVNGQVPFGCNLVIWGGSRSAVQTLTETLAGTLLPRRQQDEFPEISREQITQG